MNRQQRRQAAKDLQAQLKAAGGVDLAEKAARPKVLFMAYAAGADVKTAWHRSVLALAAKSGEYGFAIAPRDCESGPHLTKARNMLLKSFLDTDLDYLLWTDTDIAFAPQDVAMLIAADAPIAGALYFTAALGMEPWPTALVEGDEAEGDSPQRTQYVPLTLPAPPEDFDEKDEKQLAEWMETLSQPIPVAGVGLGLTLMKREAVEFVAANHEFPFEYEFERGEDLTFCLRAAAGGHQTVVVPAARVGHLKTVML